MAHSWINENGDFSCDRAISAQEFAGNIYISQSSAWGLLKNQPLIKGTQTENCCTYH